MSTTLAGMNLADVLGSIREELKTAQAASDPNNPLIVENIEVEFQVVATRSKGVKGDSKTKVEVKVLDFFKLGEWEVGGELQGSWTNASTHKVKLTLSAKTLDPITGNLDNTNVSDVDNF